MPLIEGRNPALSTEDQSSRTVEEHNRRVRWFAQEGLVLAARRALLYEVGGRRPRFILLPTRDEWDPACGCPVHTEDLDFDSWFAELPVVKHISSFPGTTCHLGNGYNIVCLPNDVHEDRMLHPNGSIRRLFALSWTGNLIVIKRARRGCHGAMHITPPEVSLINVLVERWLAEQLIVAAS